jgi:hypothetical protein
MSLRGVSITEGKIGSSVNGGREFALICNGVSVTDKVQLDTPYTLLRPSDAVALGIDAAYDIAKSVCIYRHISEFYRMAGEGVKLHIMLCAQTTKPTDLVEKAKTLVVFAGGNVTDLALAYNPTANGTVYVNGIDTDVHDAISALQIFAKWADSKDMPVHTILEGRNISDTITAMENLRGLKVGDVTLEATKVTLVVGQDWTYADTLPAVCKRFADVGNYLGVIAANAWNRNPGEQAVNNLTDTDKGVFLVGGLSNHKKYADVYDSLETMNDKGYVFPIRYTGVSGYWWNDGHVCAPIVIDKDGNMNQHTIYYSHTFDMSKRALRLAYLPEVKKVYDLENGLLPQGTVDILSEIGNQAFIAMGNLISSGTAAVDGNSDLLVKKELNVEFGVVPTGCINEIKGTLNLKNK